MREFNLGLLILPIVFTHWEKIWFNEKIYVGNQLGIRNFIIVRNILFPLVEWVEWVYITQTWMCVYWCIPICFRFRQWYPPKVNEKQHFILFTPVFETFFLFTSLKWFFMRNLLWNIKVIKLDKYGTSGTMVPLIGVYYGTVSREGR